MVSERDRRDLSRAISCAEEALSRLAAGNFSGARLAVSRATIITNAFVGTQVVDAYRKMKHESTSGTCNEFSLRSAIEEFLSAARSL